VISPLSLDGPILTIRRFRRKGFSLAELVASGTITPELENVFDVCVRSRLNVVVSGGTGSGKTTLLNVLSSLVGREERIVTIEDAAELRLCQEHVVRLESRPPNLEGEGEITIRDLVRNALRMRPDRIIVGEVRGPEALDMLQALNTGHDGSMTTVHANAAPDAVHRIETLSLMAGLALPISAVRAQIASALDIVIHLERDRQGARRVVSIAEVVKTAGKAGVKEFYKLHDGQGRFVAAPSDALVEKLDRSR
jgi:pilus assembly protein CpaF